ncbi:MAG: type II toxin-antitoxin system VapC family toxin [Pseudomonadota bacterium]
MSLLLDTHFIIASLNDTLEAQYPNHSHLLARTDDTAISVVSIWEISIKYRLGKLQLNVQPTHIGRYFEQTGSRIISIEENHATAELSVWPPTNDPFDRLLLAQCQVENMLLVTIDRALITHPLAARV